jgi:hypothetical protein
VLPEQGWVPSWRTPMLAAVAVASALMGLLVGAVLVSRRQQAWLLKEMQVRRASGRVLWGRGGQRASCWDAWDLCRLGRPAFWVVGVVAGSAAGPALSFRAPCLELPPPAPQASHAALVDEKRRMDVLLARQHNLLSCLLETGGVAGPGSASGSQAKTGTEATLGAGGS